MSHYISKSCLKANRGWTDRAIETLLGDCDKRGANPFHAYGSPVQFFEAGRVMRAEATEEFTRIREARARRSRAANDTPRATNGGGMRAERETEAGEAKP